MHYQLHPSDLVAVCIPLTYAVMVVIEHFAGGHRWPTVSGWQRMCYLCFAMLGWINCVVSSLMLRLFPGWHVFDGRRLGVVGGTVVGYAVLSWGNAAIHRAYHRNDWLWRHVHRAHHVPQRMDLAGVMYQTPWEGLGDALLVAVVTVLLLGLDPVAAMLCAWIVAFFGMFPHLNIRTPRWLGWFIQRPESHSLHHARGVHAWNYSNLPIWDMLWGTYRNQAGFEGELGLAPDRPGMWRLLRGLHSDDWATDADGSHGAAMSGSSRASTSVARAVVEDPRSG